MYIPKEIGVITKDKEYRIDSIGESWSKVLIFEDMVLKIENQNVESNNEYKMMEWLGGRLLVPEVIHFMVEDGTSYLLMTRLNGEMSCNEELLSNPKELVDILAEGLKILWDIDISSCPNNNGIDIKLKQAEYNVINNLCDMDNWEPETYGDEGFKSPEELLKWLRDNRPVEDLRFSHGDYCLPNIFINDNVISGFIDLGRSGIADLYQDVALCYRSLESNFNGRYSNGFHKGYDPDYLFEKLGIEANWEKIKWYILLDELF